MRRRLAALLGTATALLVVGAIGVAPAATAAPSYPPSSVSFKLNLPVDVDTSAVPFNQTFLAEFAGFLKVSPVRIHITSVVTGLEAPGSGIGSGRAGTGLVQLATVGTCESGGSCTSTANNDGVAKANLHFTQAGKQTITATGVDPSGKPLTVTGTVTVVNPASANGTGGLAKTGSDVIRYGLLGVGLVVIGGLLVMAVRRRSANSVA